VSKLPKKEKFCARVWIIAELMSAQASRTGAVAAAARAPKGCLGLPEDDNKHKDKRQKTPWRASKEKRHTKRRIKK